MDAEKASARRRMEELEGIEPIAVNYKKDPPPVRDREWLLIHERRDI